MLLKHKSKEDLISIIHDLRLQLAKKQEFSLESPIKPKKENFFLKVISFFKKMIKK